MVRKRCPTKQWDTAELARYGALIGTVGGMAGYVSHASEDGWFLEDSPFIHAVVDVGLGALVGSLLFAAISASRNWLKRRRDFR
jgi:hypothetical protein